MGIRRRWAFRSPRRRGGRRRRNSRRYLALVGIGVALVILAAGALILRPGSTGTTSASEKPIILYINQGNGAVNETNFGSMLSFSETHGFNTIFFQVYREGVLLFQPSQLIAFVAQAHGQGLRIYFALYFTNSSQAVPSSVFPLGEDGISLDMSTLSLSAQTSLLSAVELGFQTGQVAITTTDFTLPLKPDLLVFETYGSQDQSYIRPGIIGSVGVFATTSQADYQQQYQYALQNSDGVMVFDYAGLMKSGY